MPSFPQLLLVAALCSVCHSTLADAAPTKGSDHNRLRTVTVIATRESATQVTGGDTAALLRQSPAVSLYGAGGASSLPVIHGLNDDRIKVLLDGVQTTSACANHMNPPLSYMAPSAVRRVDIIAGITPVSQGGDSIGGTIVVESAAPVFAGPSETLHTEGELSTYYKSSGDASGAAINTSLASQRYSLGYSGAVNHSDSYDDGDGDLVHSTQFLTRNHALTLAKKGKADLLTVKLGHQKIPYQGYVNQYMDMVDNESDLANISYFREYGWGNLEARAYWQDTDHEMGFFSSQKTGVMPMLTHGSDTGYIIKAEIPFSDKDTMRIGNELHRQRLDDWWPPVVGSMMMGPNTYQNINDGERDRFSAFAEWDAQWHRQWMTQFGVRADIVDMDTGDVQAYNPMNPIPGGMGGMSMENPDAAAAIAFNARDRDYRDENFDATALLRYEPASTATYEFGIARKTRSPNLYERYSWGRGTMAMTMIGWYGDANAYVGNPDLDPEVAHTLSITAHWHDSARKNRYFGVTPYYTRVHDYIDADQIGTFNPRMAMQVTRPKLQFANHDAELYGMDLTGATVLWQQGNFGRGELKGIASWTRGKRADGSGDLYQIMPLNAHVSLEQTLRAWTNVIELQLVDDKSHVNALRDEPSTPGYALLNLRTSHQWQQLRFDLGISNVFDRFYQQPLGGVDYAGWKAEGSIGQFQPVAGSGRSLDVGLKYTF